MTHHTRTRRRLHRLCQHTPASTGTVWQTLGSVVYWVAIAVLAVAASAVLATLMLLALAP